MAPKSKAETVRDILKTMNVCELDEVTEEAARLRPSKIFPFLDLPPELRNRIYKLVVQPEDIEKHILKGKAPALLKINKQVNAEFKTLYYSHEFMNVDTYDSATKTWSQERETRLFAILLSRSIPGAAIYEHLRPEQRVRAFTMKYTEPKYSTIYMRNGVFTWTASNGMAANCLFPTDAIERAASPTKTHHRSQRH